MSEPIFSGNPFEDIPPDVPDGLYGREQIKKGIETFIENRIHHPERQKPRLAIQGTYGSGKTRTLKYYRHLINTRLFQGGKQALAVYLDAASATIDGIYKQISRSILNEADLGNAKDKMEKLIDKLNKSLIPDLPDDFSERFIALRQEYNLPESLEVMNADPYQTISAIQELLDELFALNYAGVFLLIDEVEEVHKYFTDTMANRVFQSWRQLIEQNIPILNIILAMTPEAFQVMQAYPEEKHYALRERFDVPLTLERVDEEELEKIIAGLLAEVRKPEQFDEPLYPFDRRIIPSMLRASDGIIRGAMKICHIGFTDFLQNKKTITPINFYGYLASLSDELSFDAEHLNRYQQRTEGKETEIFRVLVSALDGLTASEIKNLLETDISDGLANLQEIHKLITKDGERYKLEDYVALDLFPPVRTADIEADMKLIRVEGALAQLRESEVLNEVLKGFGAFWNISTGTVQTRGTQDERAEIIQNKVLLEVNTVQYGKRKIALIPVFESIPKSILEEIHDQLEAREFDFAIFLVLADSEELRTQIKQAIDGFCASTEIEGYFLNDTGEIEAFCSLSRFVKVFSSDTNHQLQFEGEKNPKPIEWLKLLRIIPYFAINYPPYAEEITFQYINPHLVDTCFALPNVRSTLGGLERFLSEALRGTLVSLPSERSGAMNTYRNLLSRFGGGTIEAEKLRKYEGKEIYIISRNLTPFYYANLVSYDGVTQKERKEPITLQDDTQIKAEISFSETLILEVLAKEKPASAATLRNRILSTNRDDLRKYLEILQDKLKIRLLQDSKFDLVETPEPMIRELEQILADIQEHFDKFHNVKEKAKQIESYQEKITELELSVTKMRGKQEVDAAFGMEYSTIRQEAIDCRDEIKKELDIITEDRERAREKILSELKSFRVKVQVYPEVDRIHSKVSANLELEPLKENLFTPFFSELFEQAKITLEGLQEILLQREELDLLMKESQDVIQQASIIVENQDEIKVYTPVDMADLAEKLSKLKMEVDSGNEKLRSLSVDISVATSELQSMVSNIQNILEKAEQLQSSGEKAIFGGLNQAIYGARKNLIDLENLAYPIDERTKQQSSEIRESIDSMPVLKIETLPEVLLELSEVNDKLKLFLESVVSSKQADLKNRITFAIRSGKEVGADETLLSVLKELDAKVDQLEINDFEQLHLLTELENKVKDAEIQTTDILEDVSNYVIAILNENPDAELSFEHLAERLSRYNRENIWNALKPLWQKKEIQILLKKVAQYE